MDDEVDVVEVKLEVDEVELVVEREIPRIDVKSINGAVVVGLAAEVVVVVVVGLTAGVVVAGVVTGVVALVVAGVVAGVGVVVVAAALLVVVSSSSSSSSLCLANISRCARAIRWNSCILPVLLFVQTVRG